jgi:Flp pilus assembly protein TadG
MPRIHDTNARLTRDRRGSIAAIFAVSLIPLIVAVALAVDYSFYIQAKSQFDLAADAASTHAVRIATNSYYATYSNAANNGTVVPASALTDAETLGQQAGQQWFAAQLGTSISGKLDAGQPVVNVTYLPSPGGFTATTSYNGIVPTHIGAFITPSWNIQNSSTASAPNSYLEIVMLLDNSSSMQIGASETDQLRMMELTACSPLNAYNGTPVVDGTLQSITPYGSFQFSGFGYSYDGGIQIPNQTLEPPSPALPTPPYLFNSSSILFKPEPVSGYSVPVTGGPQCTNLPKVNGNYPTAGEPCAFACHFDTTKPAGTGNDYYALARSTLGSSAPITLRFDLLKSAVNSVLTSMQNTANNGSNLNVGIYSFNTSLTTVYPPATSPASLSLSTAQTKVGSAPTTPNTADTGIQPDSFTLSDPNSHADTDFVTAMSDLLPLVGTSGDGTTFATPTKSLFLVTDGYQDVLDTGTNSGVVSGVDLPSCTKFKSAGYTIYVVYTPYYPLMHYWYYLNNQATVEGTGPGSLSYNLQSCAGTSTQNGFQNPNYYQSAETLPQLTAALNKFLQSALDASTRVAR